MIAIPRRRALGLLAATIAAPAAPRAEPAAAEASQRDSAAAAFDEVWRIVKERFYDPGLRGLDWSAVGAQYRAAATEAPDAPARAAVINRMLARLNASHTALYTEEDPAYYELADIFARSLQRQGLNRVFAGGQVRYPGIGLFTRTDPQGRVFASGVIDGAPAARAGVLTGDELLAVDAAPFRPVVSFRGRIGASVPLTLRRRPEAPPVTLTVTPESLDPGAMFLAGLQASARLIPARDGRRIGYVHVWSYASPRYQEALERLLSEGALRDADALVWDLRGGWGGAQAEYLDLFAHDGVTLQITGRDGAPHLDNPRWRKPVAMLVNEATRSGKEVLAEGFRQARMGPIVGARTEGAVLAASAFLIGDNSLLLLAVDDVKVNGARLEGVGVEPTVPVPFDLRYAAGADPQLDRAVALLAPAR